jgi:hypothetical protein
MRCFFFALALVAALLGHGFAQTVAGTPLPKNVWVKQFENNPGFTGAAVDSKGDIVAIRSTNQGIEVTKLQVDGRLLWQKRISKNSYDTAKAIAADSKGNIYIVGETFAIISTQKGYKKTAQNSTIKDFEDYEGIEGFIAKLDPNGKVVWIMQMAYKQKSSSFCSLAFDRQGELWIGGSTETVDDTNLLLVKVTTSGMVRLSNSIAIAERQEWGCINTIYAKDSSNDIFIAGYAGDKGGFFARTDAEGKLRWQRPPGEVDVVYKILALPNKSLALAGSAGIFATVTGYSTSGEQLWQTRFSGNTRTDSRAIFYDIDVVGKSIIAVGGISADNQESWLDVRLNNKDLLIAKLSIGDEYSEMQPGERQWERVLGTNRFEDRFSAIGINKDRLILAGLAGQSFVGQKANLPNGFIASIPNNIDDKSPVLEFLMGKKGPFMLPKVFSTPNSVSSRFIGSDMGDQIKLFEATDNGLVIVGQTEAVLDDDFTPKEVPIRKQNPRYNPKSSIFMAKFDQKQKLIWMKQWLDQERERVITAKQQKDGSVIVAGYTDKSANVQPWLSKISSDGQWLWKQNLSIDANVYEPFLLAFDNNINVFYQANQVLIQEKYNQAGALLATTKYPLEQRTFEIAVPTADGFILAATMQNPKMQLAGDRFAILNPDGTTTVGVSIYPESRWRDIVLMELKAGRLNKIASYSNMYDNQPIGAKIFRDDALLLTLNSSLRDEKAFIGKPINPTKRGFVLQLQLSHPENGFYPVELDITSSWQVIDPIFSVNEDIVIASNIEVFKNVSSIMIDFFDNKTPQNVATASIVASNPYNLNQYSTSAIALSGNSKEYFMLSQVKAGQKTYNLLSTVALADIAKQQQKPGADPNPPNAQYHSYWVSLTLTSALNKNTTPAKIAAQFPICMKSQEISKNNIFPDAPSNVKSCTITAQGNSDFTVRVETTYGKVFINGVEAK